MVTSAQVETRMQAALATYGTRSRTAAERQLGIDRHVQLKWSRRLQTTGNVMDAPRSGRPKALTDRACEHMERLVHDHPGITLKEIVVMLHEAGHCGRVVSPSTIKLALETRCPNVSRVQPLHEEVLTQQQMQSRMEFARRHAARSWKDVLFVDACKFTFASAQRHTRQGVLAYKGKRPVVKKGDKHMGLCVYGGVSFKGKTPLVFVTGSSHIAPTYKLRNGQRHSGVGVEEYINIMEAHLIPAGRKLHGDKLVYLHDWSGCHNSRAVKSYQCAAGLTVMNDFPSRSPDINIIENVWAWIDPQLGKKKYNTLDSFQAALNDAWDTVPEQMLKKCAGSMKARLRAIVKAGGRRIKTQGL